MFREGGQTRKHCSQAMFPAGGQTTKHCFLAMFPQGRQTRKRCSLAMFSKSGQTRKHCFLEVQTSVQNITLGSVGSTSQNDATHHSTIMSTNPMTIPT